MNRSTPGWPGIWAIAERIPNNTASVPGRRAALMISSRRRAISENDGGNEVLNMTGRIAGYNDEVQVVFSTIMHLTNTIRSPLEKKSLLVESKIISIADNKI
ncbi:MAG TPA: hypothetical protein DCZ10_17130 [Pelotomaculum sp.]|nr:hypothetical protein [Pelotomaculum sp.]